MNKAHTYSIGSVSEINYGFKNYFRVFTTCENIYDIFETIKERFHRKCRACQIGNVKFTFPIERLEVKPKFVYKILRTYKF